MFKQRLLTAIFLIPIVIGLIYFGNSWALSAAVLVLFVALGWEWLPLIALNDLSHKIYYMLALLFLLMLNVNYLNIAIIADLCIWALIILAILTYPKSQSYWGKQYIVALVGLLVLPVFLSCLYVILLSGDAADYFVYLLSLVWATDIGAYLFGKKFGKHKLIPSVSPGKTIEGTFGGIIFALVIAVIGYFYFQQQSIMAWFLVAWFVIIISIFGDLFISMLKRRCKLKDTGNILPGHGGVLDRLDSLIAALPAFYFFYDLFWSIG
jgi:phosphatidate cytidylyltransferase